MSVRDNPVKRKLRQGLPTIGVWMGLDHPGIAEILADSGFDWIVFDLEHGHYTLNTLRSALDALRGHAVSPMVRVPANDPVTIKQILDLGPEGLVIPMVCTAEEARRAAAACKYPPEGTRGIGAGRATQYGRSFAEYIDNANDRILVVVQIEHIDAVAQTESIAAVEGIDCLFIGPNDLAASMGRRLDPAHPDVRQAVERIFRSGRAAGIPVGMWCDDERHAAEMAARGMQFLPYTSDAGLLSLAAAGSVRRVRQLLHAT